MVDILAIGAHPDDIEFGCGGILAKMAAQGKSIAMLVLTLGEMGTHGTPDVRRQECNEAAQLIGATRFFLDLGDCQLMDTYEGRLELVKVIRECKPRLVLAPFWKGERNHPDHVACGAMARYACRYARFEKILPDVSTHRPEGILHYPPGGYTGPIDFIVDVTDHVEIWKEMINCHHSQLLTLPYLDWNLRIASRLGVLIHKPYAQGIIKGNPVVVDNLMDIAQGTVEL